MERRSLLKVVGGIGVTAGASGVGVLAMSGGASATSNADYNDVTITSDDGSVEYVAIFGKSVVEWDGFENPATEFRIINEGRVQGSGEGWIQLNNTGRVPLSQGDDWGGDGESLSGEGTSGTIESDIGLRSNGKHDPETDWHVVGSDPDGYGLPQNSIDPALLESDSDGGTENFTVEIRSRYTWFNSAGGVEFEDTYSSGVNVTVNNEPANATATSSNGGAVGE